MTRSMKPLSLLTLSAAAASLALLAAPAHATTGQQAVGMCNLRPSTCSVLESGGDIIIEVDNGPNGRSTIYCQGRSGECTVTQIRQRPRLRGDLDPHGNLQGADGPRAPSLRRTGAAARR